MRVMLRWRTPASAAATLAVAVVAACVQDGRRDAPAGDAPAEFAAHETLRLGVLDQGGPASFDDVRGVALGDAGHLLVANGGDGTVRVFHPDGTFLTRFGGLGDGPTEVRSFGGLVVVGDTAVVVDSGRKVLLFRRDGTFLGSWPTREPDGTSVIPIRPVGDGWLAWLQEPPATPPPTPGDSLRRFVETTTIDRLGGRPVGPPVHRVTTAVVYGTPEGRAVEGLFRQSWSRGFDARGRLFVVDPDAYRVHVFGRDGSLERTIERPFDAHPITEASVRAFRERTMEVLDTLTRGPFPIPPEVREQQRVSIAAWIDQAARLPMPSAASPLGRILVSDDGSFWVEHVDPAGMIEDAVRRYFGTTDSPPAPTRWGVFGPDGTYLGTASLPARFRPMAVRGQEVAGVWRDPLDVEYVLRLEAR